jgi:ribosomal protein L40E
MKVKLGDQLICKRCNHRWLPRAADVRQCPKCKTARFDQPKEES